MNLHILDIAREAGIPVAPHRGGETWGLHLIVSSDCLDLSEQNPGDRSEPQDELWIAQPSVKDGYMQPNEAPGFGVWVNDAML